jgi:hypothetical protein
MQAYSTAACLQAAQVSLEVPASAAVGDVAPPPLLDMAEWRDVLLPVTSCCAVAVVLGPSGDSLVEDTTLKGDDVGSLRDDGRLCTVSELPSWPPCGSGRLQLLLQLLADLNQHSSTVSPM